MNLRAALIEVRVVAGRGGFADDVRVPRWWMRCSSSRNYAIIHGGKEIEMSLIVGAGRAGKRGVHLAESLKLFELQTPAAGFFRMRLIV